MIEKLTTRQRQVLELASRGLANKEIARELNISKHTVKNYFYAIFKKLNVTNRYAAARIFAKSSDEIEQVF